MKREKSRAARRLARLRARVCLLALREPAKKARPVESTPRIAFPLWRDIAVGCDISNRQRLQQIARQTRKAIVLAVVECGLVGSFKLYSDGKIVAAGPAAPCRRPGMPCPQVHRHELLQRAVAAHQEMGRNAQVPEFLEARMGRGVETVREQSLDRIAPELSRRKAYRMHHEQRHRHAFRPLVAVGRSDELGTGIEAVGADHRQLPEPVEGPGSRISRRCMRYRS